MSVVRLDPSPATVEVVTTLLCEAFAEYPVMRFVLGPGEDYPARLRRLIGLFVTNRAVPGHPFFGISIGPELAGVALCTPPNPPPASTALQEIRERAWAALGHDARERYDACVRAWTEVGIAEPNLHLNMLGVRPRSQGQGLASPLMERVHALSRELPPSRGVTLTTEDPRNVPLYRRFGYEVVGRRPVAPGLETWGFFRRDEGGASGGGGASLEG
ncbi:MAG TPA: GNAT family N-acetyltransferase [Gemmatimonadales bacterium]